MLKKTISFLMASLLFVLPTIISPVSKVKAAQITTPFEAVFSNYDSSKWEKSDWANGSVFNCVWKPSQVTFSNGKMVLNLDKEYGGTYPYKSGEFRTKDFFGYGYYEVRMKAAKNIGTVSSFFTYTGESDNNPWDEIDIEILGKDTTKVQFNWYKNGSAGNEYFHNLGFDASQSFHTYGFEWRQNYIDYYIDGKKVYRGTRNIPVTPGKIMMNLWPGKDVDEWLGRYDGKTPLQAEYEYVKYYPNGVPQGGSTSNPVPTATPTPTPRPNTPPPASNASFEAVFSNYDSNKWEKSDWANGSVFNCVWKPSQVTSSNGKVILNLDREYGGTYPYKSGEYRTKEFFGYGYYEVRMKAAKNIGIVSSFFTYTGESDNNPWDEIDIEILGKDTTKVQFNWYKNGSGGNEYFHNLGFDASQSFHTYGFEWRQNYIDYYIDGQKVYRGTRNIPVTPGKIMMNLWPGKDVDEWLGRYDGKTPLQAEYEYVKYYPNGVPQGGWTPPPAPTPTSIVPSNKGDVNGDGYVDSTDYSLYKRYLLKIISNFPVSDLKVADVNNDGNVDSIDYALVKRYILGIISGF